jgi:hypothetical protein
MFGCVNVPSIPNNTTIFARIGTARQRSLNPVDHNCLSTAVRFVQIGKLVA